MWQIVAAFLAYDLYSLNVYPGGHKYPDRHKYPERLISFLFNQIPF